MVNITDIGMKKQKQREKIITTQRLAELWREKYELGFGFAAQSPVLGRVFGFSIAFKADLSLGHAGTAAVDQIKKVTRGKTRRQLRAKSFHLPDTALRSVRVGGRVTFAEARIDFSLGWLERIPPLVGWRQQMNVLVVDD